MGPVAARRDEGHTRSEPSYAMASVPVAGLLPELFGGLG